MVMEQGGPTTCLCSWTPGELEVWSSLSWRPENPGSRWCKPPSGAGGEARCVLCREAGRDLRLLPRPSSSRMMPATLGRALCCCCNSATAWVGWRPGRLIWLLVLGAASGEGRLTPWQRHHVVRAPEGGREGSALPPWSSAMAPVCSREALRTAQLLNLGPRA